MIGGLGISALSGGGGGLVAGPLHRYWRSNKTNGAAGGNTHMELSVKDGFGAAVTITSGMLSQSGLSSFNASQLVDGNNATGGFNTDSAGIGSYLQIDFGAGNEKDLHSWNYRTNGALTAIWDIEYSDDAMSWTKVYIGLNTGGGAANYIATW